jgi:hypothetical protein
VLAAYDTSYVADALSATTDPHELPADTDLLAADIAAEAASAADATNPAQLAEWEAWQAAEEADWMLAEPPAPPSPPDNTSDNTSWDVGSWASSDNDDDDDFDDDDDGEHPWYHLQWVDYTVVPFAEAVPPNGVRLCTCVLG